jgi:hypothetical protein
VRTVSSSDFSGFSDYVLNTEFGLFNVIFNSLSPRLSINSYKIRST